MSTFVQVCEKDKIANGGMRTVRANGDEVVVIRDGDNFYAFRNVCSHEEFPLSEGWVEDGCLHCAFHGAKFDLKSGEPLSLPAFESVKTYPVRINAGMIEIEVE